VVPAELREGMGSSPREVVSKCESPGRNELCLLLERLSLPPKPRKVFDKSQWWVGDHMFPDLEGVILPGRFRYLDLPCFWEHFTTLPASLPALFSEQYPLRPDGRHI